MKYTPFLSSQSCCLRHASRARALLAVFALAVFAVPSVNADVVFTRNTATGEQFTLYTATYTAPTTGSYTLGFNLTAGGPSGDNSILIDAVKITNGATTVFADGFETPALSTNQGVSANGGSATFGAWDFLNYSGILNGSPPNWGLAGAASNPPAPFTLYPADGTHQYAYLQAAAGKLGKMKAGNTLALVAGQTYTISFYQGSRYDFGGTTTYTVTLDYVPPMVYASGISPVIAWDPIFPAGPVVPDYAESKPVPTVGYNDPRWTNPHPATVFPKNSHVWEWQSWVPSAFKFDANWINAWSNLQSNGHGKSVPSWNYYPYYGVPYQSWTKYSTTITGAGDFVLQFFADNASWIYIDGVLVGFQDYNWATNGTGRYTISLTGAGPHELSFVIWDGGGLAGGKFRIETAQSFQNNNPTEPLPPPPPPADSTPPVITAPSSITKEATSAAGAVVTFTATANDGVSGTVPVTATPPSGSTFAIGISSVSLTATDAAGNAAHAGIVVTVQDTTAPALNVPANQTREATSAAGAVATFTATATDAVGVTSLTYSAASGSTFPIGTTTVTVTAKDAAGNTSTGSFTITVRDTTAPVIASLSPSTGSLWSPNHKMVAITIAASATDAVGVASLKIISVTSNEPDNGLGDGDTAGDIEITGPLTLNLRAERSGKGNGRTYTITVEAKDAAGNATTKTTSVFVPKSQGGK